MNEIVPSKDAKVTLRKITGRTVRAICSLSVSEEQKYFVAPNAFSIARLTLQRLHGFARYTPMDPSWLRHVN